MQQEFHLVSYVATKNSSVQELQHIVAMFAHLEITCAEAKVSEYLNINNYFYDYSFLSLSKFKSFLSNF